MKNFESYGQGIPGTRLDERSGWLIVRNGGGGMVA